MSGCETIPDHDEPAAFTQAALRRQVEVLERMAEEAWAQAEIKNGVFHLPREAAGSRS